MNRIKWSYGVMTVPSRRENLLKQTLASLILAGFEKPRLFVDGETDPSPYEKFGLPVTLRYPAVRTAGNWTLALWELYIREPAATYYALFQDDFVTYRNLRQYLEQCQYPHHGYLNLYTFPENEALAPDHTGWYPSNQWGRGAVALVFSLEAVVLLLSQQHFVERPQDVHRGWRSIDGGIVTAMKKAGWKEYVHYPSLVQHTGEHSSMGNNPHAQSASFRGPQFNALELLPCSTPSH